MEGITFDTGALVALERRRPRISQVFLAAKRQKRRITVPAAVLVEWWRGRSDFRNDLLESTTVEELDRDLAQAAGEALAVIEGATAIDAIVMASAARRGDVVYTSDVDDLLRLQRHFRDARVLAV